MIACQFGVKLWLLLKTYVVVQVQVYSVQDLELLIRKIRSKDNALFQHDQ